MSEAIEEAKRSANRLRQFWGTDLVDRPGVIAAAADSIDDLLSTIDRLTRERDEARAGALEEAAKWIEMVGRDWRADGQSHKRYAADYLAAGIRSLPRPTGAAEGGEG